MFEKVKIPVCFSCNDYRNGNFEEKVSAFVFGEYTLKLDSQFADWSPKMRVKGGKIFIAGKGFPYLEYKSWYGNWCWDLAVLYGEDVLKMLNWLKQKDWFQVEEGEHRMTLVFNDKNRIFVDKDIAIFQKET
jgi:hypothetical protein